MLFTDEQIDNIERLFHQFLQGMPEIGVNKDHPGMATVEVGEPHAYIKESFGNFLEQVPRSESDYDLVLPIDAEKDYVLSMNIDDMRLNLVINMEFNDELHFLWDINDEPEAIKEMAEYETNINDSAMEFKHSDAIDVGSKLFLKQERIHAYIGGLDLDIYAHDEGLSVTLQKEGLTVYEMSKSTSDLREIYDDAERSSISLS
jgi:hypothetical protein